MTPSKEAMKEAFIDKFFEYVDYRGELTRGYSIVLEAVFDNIYLAEIAPLEKRIIELVQEIKRLETIIISNGLEV